MNGILAIWQRDILKFFINKAKVIGSFAMPFMFLILFGSGMNEAIDSLTAGAK